MRKATVIVFTLLFLGLGFNAYACLIPIYGSLALDMQSDCSEPLEQPAGQFCDGFKTLGVQASPASDSHYVAGSAAGLVSTPFPFDVAVDYSRWQHPPIETHPRELCSSTIVLRI